jgi:hypothetical protein
MPSEYGRHTRNLKSVVKPARMQEIMKDPVVLCQSGISYERNHLEAWLCSNRCKDVESGEPNDYLDSYVTKEKKNRNRNLKKYFLHFLTRP